MVEVEENFVQPKTQTTTQKKPSQEGGCLSALIGLGVLVAIAVVVSKGCGSGDKEPDFFYPDRDSTQSVSPLGGTDIAAFTDTEEDFRKFAMEITRKEKNDIPLAMLVNKRVITIQKGTRVRIIYCSGISAHVEIQTGPHAGRSGYMLAQEVGAWKKGN